MKVPLPAAMQDLCEREGLFFMETSALSGANVGAAFEELVQRIYANMAKTLQAEAGSEEELQAAAALHGRRIIVAHEAPASEPQRSRCCG